MNKKEFVKELSKELDITEVQATKNLDAVLKCIAQSLKENDILKLKNFGTFKKRQVKARDVKIPSGYRVEVPAHKRVVFSVGKELKEVVNNKQ